MIGKLKTIVYADLFNKPIKFLLLRNSAYLLPKQVMGYDVCLQQFYPSQVNDTMSIYLWYWLNIMSLRGANLELKECVGVGPLQKN